MPAHLQIKKKVVLHTTGKSWPVELLTVGSYGFPQLTRIRVTFGQVHGKEIH